MNEVSFEFKAIGTSWHIAFLNPKIFEGYDTSVIESEQLITLIKTRIETFEQNYSRFRNDSFVGQIARQAGSYELPDDAEAMLTLYRSLYDITNGKVTPLIGSVLEDAGYDTRYSLIPKNTILKACSWDEVMKYHAPFLITKQPLKLDFGALGKGYIVDIVAALLREHGRENYTVNAGGDIAYSTTIEKVYKVGLEDPADPTQIIGVAELVNKSIAGSAGNRRAWDKYHHIIDPDLTESPRHIAAVWVVAATTIVADGLTTALFFTTPEVLQEHFDFEYVIVYADRSAKVSKDFPGMLYS
jgi:thiamine biosynthesis lipoprotein